MASTAELRAILYSHVENLAVPRNRGERNADERFLGDVLGRLPVADQLEGQSVDVDLRARTSSSNASRSPARARPTTSGSGSRSGVASDSPGARSPPQL